MALLNNTLGVLLVGEDGWPSYFPLDRFVVTDWQLPSEWEFTTRTGFMSAVWGYPTLIRDRDHFGALRSRRESARRIFLEESGVRGFDEEADRFID
ncbi:hypothetical protein [Nocardia terrae]|uniref:hypothetical protein n=1 Tax=Nocardia terrae TaxID=2675851 RepID=UPI001F40E3B6|nr:hypothetical protein [Nocardia terrae]